MNSGAGSTAFRILAAVALFLMLMIPAGNLRPGNLGSGLLDPDSYSRLLRVEHLLGGGSWYDTSTPWVDGPAAGELHWTRPLDVLVAALALPASAGLPMRQAILLGGSLLPLLLGCLLVVVIALAARPFLGGWGLLLVGFAVAAQQALAYTFRYSYVDHHSLILLCCAIGWTGAVRSFSHESRRAAIVSGIAAGLGVWVSVESLGWIGVVSVALALLWILEGTERHVRWLTTMLSSAAATAALALVAERPPAQWLTTESDRLSISHLAFLALTAGAWQVVRRRTVTNAPQPLARRVVWTATAFVLPLAASVAVFPSLRHGPLAAVDSSVVPLLFDGNAEFNRFDAGNGIYLSSFAGAILPVIFALAWALLAVRKGEDSSRRLGVLTLVFLAVFVPAGLLQWRWFLFAQTASVLPWLLAIRTAFRAPDDAGAARRTLRVPFAVMLAVGHVALQLALFPHDTLRKPVAAARRAETVPPAAASPQRALPAPARTARPRSTRAARFPQCSDAGVGRLLSSVSGRPPREILVAAPFFDGPQLAWQGGVRVIAGPYHRNGAGILDIVSALAGADEREARRILDRRRAEFIVLCAGGSPTLALGRRDARGLTARLLRNDVPSWLEQVPVARGMDRRLGIFRIGHAAETPAVR